MTLSIWNKIVFSTYFLWRGTRHILFWIGRVLMCFIIGIPFVHSVQLLELYSLSQLFSNYIHDIALYDIPFTYLICYVIIPKYLLTEKYKQFCLYIFLAFNIGIATYIYIEYSNTMAMGLKHQEVLPVFNIIFVIRKIKVFLTYTGVSFILFATIKIFKSWYLKEMENQRLIALNAAAKIEILRSRIHPHFLFNTLNTIYSFTLFDRSKTKAMLDRLYNILHYMIYDCNTATIALSKEIGALLDYINLEKERYGDKLILNITQSGSWKEKQITPLLLQPFIENAFKHGASKMIYHPWIDISMNIVDDHLHFDISNGVDNSGVASGRLGIGLDNIRRRLVILYPNRHVFETNNTESVFSVKLVIPVSSGKLGVKNYELLVNS